MNIITGERDLDDGRRWLSPGTTIGYMKQHVDPIPGQSVGEFVFSGILPNGEDWDQSYKVDMIIAPLGLNAHEMMDKLSGGLLRRAALAKSLVEEPDILLLDEPTNHMDLEVIQWLENYLKYYAGAVICISHDRAFLAAITDRVFWLDRGKLKVSPQGFAYFEEWSNEVIDAESKQLRNRERKVEMELEWANRGVKARVKRNVRRQQLAWDARDKLENDKMAFRRATSKINLASPKADESALNVAEFINVHKSFGDKIILEKFNMRIRRRDRIGIMGKNGSGKTSFLRMLIDELEPDGGKVKMAKNLEFSYFDQKRSALDKNKTLQENLCPPGADHLEVRGKQRHICGYLKDFLFEAEDAWRSVKTLSGGQMNRLMLSKVLANPGSFLILDEPTNDLDMDTLDMLEAVLEAYDGTLFVVSHDREFLDQVVDKLLVFEGDGKVEMIVGGYSDYLAFKQSRPPEKESETEAKKKPAAKTAKFSAAAPKSERISYKIQYELEQLPKTIRTLESECAQLEEKINDPDLYAQDQRAFLQISQRLGAAKLELDAAESRWLELEELRASIEQEA